MKKYGGGDILKYKVICVETKEKKSSRPLTIFEAEELALKLKANDSNHTYSVTSIMPGEDDYDPNQ